MSSDRLEVTVAAFGPAFGYPGLPVFVGAQFEDQGPDVPYSKRLKIEREVFADETLGSVIERAAESFGVSSPDGPMAEVITGVVFYKPEDEAVFQSRPEPWPNAIRIVDEHNQPSWTLHWSGVKYKELLAASDARLIDGDVQRPYLWPTIPQADLLHLMADGLWRAFEVWEIFLASREGLRFARTLADRLQRGKDAVHDPALARSLNRRPNDLDRFLETPRSADEVASYLECDRASAEGLLWVWGFVRGSDGLWREGVDDAARLLRATVNSIRLTGWAPNPSDLERLVDECEREND